eukprot:c25834_g1_i1 orf=228-641(-)
MNVTAVIIVGYMCSTKACATANKKRERAPKFAIKARSKIDIIDDGYSWRKYGQKAVKHSLYPRSYYRCRKSQCPAKKQVERFSQNPEFVMTTYEGIHNHQNAAAINLVHQPINLLQDFPFSLQTQANDLPSQVTKIL